MTVEVVGRPAPSDASDRPQVRLRQASPGYFDVMRLRLRDGRFYTRLDGAGSPRVVVVNETFAREALGGEPAVGQRLRFGRGGGDDAPWEVIGVVADVRYGGLAVTESSAEVFVSTHQMEAAPGFALRLQSSVHRRAHPRRSARGDPLPRGVGDGGRIRGRRSTM